MNTSVPREGSARQGRNNEIVSDSGTNANVGDQIYSFDAFLSYATHPDYKLVRRLESFLETFHTLKPVSGDPLRKLEICTDIGDFQLPSLKSRKANTEVAPSVTPLIEEYLAKSRFLLVLSCPEAVQSRWIQHEVQWFLKNRGPDSILLAVTAGDPVGKPESVFPAAIREFNLHKVRSCYDFRGAFNRYRPTKETEVIKDFEEQCVRLAADLIGRPPGELRPLWYREKRKQQRRRTLILSSIIVVLLVLLFITVIARREAVLQRDRAEERERLATSRQLAAQALTQLDTQPEQALLLALVSRRMAPTVETESSLLSALLGSPRLYKLLYRGDNSVHTVAYSPDGRTIAAGTYDGLVLHFDAFTGQRLVEPLKGHTELVQAVRFDPKGKFLASGSEDGQVILWDTLTGQRLQTLLDPESSVGVNEISISVDGRKLAAGRQDGKISLWSLEDGKPLGPPLEANGVMHVAFDPGGERLVSASLDDGIRLWDLATRKTVKRLPVNQRDANFYMAFDPTGKYLAVSGKRHEIELWELESTYKSPLVLKGQDLDVASLTFSRDGRWVASGNERGIMLWETSTGQKQATEYKGHTYHIHDLAFSPDGRFLVSGSSDNTIRIWSLEAVDPIGRRLGTHSDEADCIRFSPDGKFLVSGAKDGSVILWNVETGKQVGDFSRKGASIHDIAFSSDGRLLAFGGSIEKEDLFDEEDGRVWLVELESNEFLDDPLFHPEIVRSLTFSPDNTLLIVGEDGESIYEWDINARQLRTKHDGLGENLISDVIFTKDGKHIVFGVWGEKEIRVWNIESWKPMGDAFRTPDNTSLALSRDNTMMLSGGGGGTIFLWNFEKREVLRRLTGLRTYIYKLAFSPDERRFASAGNEGVWLWDVAGGTRLGQRLYSETLALDVAFSPDGSRVAATSTDGSVWVWNLSLENWERAACRIANRNLSSSEWHQYMGDRPYFQVCSEFPDGSGK